MKTFRYEFALDAWFQGVDVDANTEEDAREELLSMTLDELLDAGYVKQFELKDIDCTEVDDDYSDEDDGDVDIDW